MKKCSRKDVMVVGMKIYNKSFNYFTRFLPKDLYKQIYSMVLLNENLKVMDIVGTLNLVQNILLPKS